MHRKSSNSSVLDLVFYSNNLNNNKNFFSWKTDPEIASGSDHEILFYAYKNIENMASNPILDLPYNFEKADWKSFSENINKFNKQYSLINLDLDSEIELENQAEILQRIITKTAEISIPRKKVCSKSKAWWNNNLSKLRKDFGKAKRIWYSNKNNEELYDSYIIKRNIYFQEIKNAKTSMWNKFLEKAEGKEIFKAFSYTKKRFLNRLPTLYYEENNIKKTAISFPQKCDAFFATLFKEPPISEEIDLNTPYLEKYKWPTIKEHEIKNAIFQPSKNKAPGPDKISFIILQNAYNNIKERFHIIYKALIRKGYHPKCWKKALGVILKKPQKKDNSNPKSYRIISLLNCLGKISKRI